MQNDEEHGGGNLTDSHTQRQSHTQTTRKCLKEKKMRESKYSFIVIRGSIRQMRK